MADPQRYAVVLNGQIMSVMLWDGVTSYTPLVGTTLMLEADAVAAGLPRYVPPDPTVKAQAAIAANRANVTQDQTIASGADAIANATTALTNAQLTTQLRQLAQAIATLARNDIQGSRQRNALIQLVLAAFDDTNA